MKVADTSVAHGASQALMAAALFGVDIQRIPAKPVRS
jgi:hypothetical protein